MSINMPEPVVDVDGFDPYNSASNPELPAFELWGMLEVNAWACALVKGVGKVPYDKTIHDRRATAIDLFVQPLPEQNITNAKSCERHLIAESKEWANITWKSIKDLGIDNLREVNGKWTRVAVVPNGKTYKNKDGEVKDETTFKVIAFFDDEEKCRAAYLASGGHAASPVMTSFDPDGTSAPVVSQDDTDKQTALAFLKVIIPTACNGKTTLEEKKIAITIALAQYPTVSKFFTADSPEVIALIGA